MEKNNDLLNYIEVSANFRKYIVCKNNVNNYEQFWAWLTTNDSNEFIVKDFAYGKTTFIRSSIMSFSEKNSNRYETSRSKKYNELMNSFRFT